MPDQSQGPGDLRISAALVGLKKESPDRTVLLLGNRDVNKMRFRSELHDSDLARDLSDLPPPFWIPLESLVSFPPYLRG